MSRIRRGHAGYREFGHQRRLFSHSNYAIHQPKVASDLSIDLTTDGTVYDLSTDADSRGLDAIIVVGGYRSALSYDVALLDKLRAGDHHDLLLGGLWNGSLALAQAGLLDQSPCALHPDNHAFTKNSRPFVWPMPVMLAVQGA